MTFLIDFKTRMGEFGLTPEDIIADGRIHRFSTGKRDKNGWYVLHLDSEGAGGAFGDWGNDINEKWCSFNSDQNPEYVREVFKKIEESRKVHEAERADAAKNAEKQAKEIWGMSEPLGDKIFEYLALKGVSGSELRLEKGTSTLLCPMFAPGMKLVNVQRIFPNGDKRFLKDATKKGACCFLRGIHHDRVFIVEGYATGETIRNATGQDVFVAFDAGNLYPVCDSVLRKSKVPVVICADSDMWNEKNIGLIKANICRDKFGVMVISPKFKDVTTKPTDFNDLQNLEGIQRVTELLDKPFMGNEERIRTRVRKYALSSRGKFTTFDIDRELGLEGQENRNARFKEIYSLIQQGLVEQDDNKRDTFRALDHSLNVFDLSRNIEEPHFDINLPLGISEHAKISERNLIMIAGESNAGKTTLAIEMLLENIHIQKGNGRKMFYFTSEMSQAELVTNLDRFGGHKLFLDCQFIDRQFEVYDVIKTNNEMQKGLVFIDFLETRGGEYNKTASEVQKIYESMTTGVCVVLVQKQPGKEWAKGGSGMLEKPRVAINLSHLFRSPHGTVCVAKIAKCKTPARDDYSIDGMSLIYIVNKEGATPLTKWGYVTQEQMDAIVLTLKNELGVTSSHNKLEINNGNVQLFT